MKVALVHDYLIEYGGAERVLEALHEIYPEAPIYTAYYNLELLGPHKARFKKWDIRSSWLQKIPFARKLVSPFRIFAPMIFEGFDLKEYDLVISSCNTYFSKAVITKPEALHLSYIHTPTKYLYGYTTSFNYKKWFITRIIGELMNHFLRIYDFETSQRSDVLVANSKNVADRINKFYRRDSVVIYPPVSLPSFPRRRESNGSPIKSGMTNKDYYLSIGRLVRGKGIEIVIKACSELNLALKVASSGPELNSLKKIAGKTVEFIGEVKDEELPELYANAKALIVASDDEDFGITAVEAMACATPVIAPKAGGYLETVIEGKTGEFFPPSGSLGDPNIYTDTQVVVNLIKVLEKFDPNKYQEEDCKKQAEKFSKERFKEEILELVNKNI